VFAKAVSDVKVLSKVGAGTRVKVSAAD
jgi:hypothetical protein